MSATQRKTKTVGEVLDFGFNYADEFAAISGSDTISTSTWTIESGITNVSSGNDTTTTNVFLSGGTLGEEYTCDNKIVTAGGRTYERSLIVLIVAKKYQ